MAVVLRASFIAEAKLTCDQGPTFHMTLLVLQLAALMVQVSTSGGFSVELHPCETGSGSGHP